MPLRCAAAAALVSGLVCAADPSPVKPFARVGSAAWLHPEQPLALAAHPDGKTLASGGSDGSVRVWDVGTGTVRHTIPCKGGASALAYSADGKWLAVHFGDELVRLFETGKYTEAKAIPVKNGDHLALSGDGKLLIASGPLGNVSLLEVSTGQNRMDLPPGRAAAVLPSGKAVAVAGEGNVVQVLEVPSGKPRETHTLPSGEDGRVSHLVFHHAGKRIAVATTGNKPTVRVFDLNKQEAKFAVPGEGPLAFVGETGLVGRLNGKLAVWDATTGKLLRTMGDGVTTLAVSPDGKLAATDGGVSFPSPRIHLWDLKTGTATNRTADDLADLRGITPEPRGGLTVVAGGKLMTWKPGAGKTTLDTDVGPVRAVAPFGKSQVIANETGQLFALSAPVRPLANVPDGVRFLSADAKAGLIAAATVGEKSELLLVNVEQRAIGSRWPLPARPLGVTVDPAGKLVGVIGRDGYVRVWKTDAVGKGTTPPELWKERLARSFRGGIAFAPDGKHLAVTSLMRVTVHEAESGKRVAQFERTWDDGPFTSLAYSPDGRFLAAGTQGGGGAAVVWELVTQQRAARFPVGGTVTGVAYLADGRTLVTAGADDNLLAWDQTGRRGTPTPGEAEFASAWSRLGDVNPENAYPATAIFRDGGRAAAEFLLKQLATEKDLDAKVKTWASQLADREYAVRDRATKELIAVGGIALPVLAEAEKTTQSAEWKSRAKTIRSRIHTAAEALPDPALLGVPLRRLRAAAALEGIADPTATTALELLRDLGGPAGKDAANLLRKRVK